MLGSKSAHSYELQTETRKSFLSLRWLLIILASYLTVFSYVGASQFNFVFGFAVLFAASNIVLSLLPVDLYQSTHVQRVLRITDSIFVGGSGREISHVLESAYRRLRPGGRLVANVGSIESLSAVHQTLERLEKDTSVWMINVARGTYQLERVRFEALNPTFLLSAVKPNGHK